MAHYALVKNGIVKKIHVVNNDVLTDQDGIEHEEWGRTFLANLHGYESTDLVQCSYNGNLRAKFPGPDWIYDKKLDVFISPKPFPSWVLKDTVWEAPISKPSDGNFYEWNEANQTWEIITLN